MKVNINDTVRFKETPYGKTVREAHWKHYGIVAAPLEKDADGWSTSQLWDIMAVYGSAIHLGGEVPIETEIEIEPSAK
jgi:hypothetical protein